MNHTMLKIRTRLAGTAILTLALASTAWAHNPWPPTDQPVQIVVTAPPGSVDDTIARLVAEQLGSRLGSRFMVSNQPGANGRSEEHTSELQSLMRISYAVFCFTKKNKY